MTIKKVSFDFDGTLGDVLEVQEYAKELMLREGVEVWITTRRYDKVEKYTDAFLATYNIKSLKKQHGYLFELAEEIGIPLERIIFTNMKSKYIDLNIFKPVWHLDDDLNELYEINNRSKTIGIHVESKNWKEKCERFLG